MSNVVEDGVHGDGGGRGREALFVYQLSGTVAQKLARITHVLGHDLVNLIHFNQDSWISGSYWTGGQSLPRLHAAVHDIKYTR